MILRRRCHVQDMSACARPECDQIWRNFVTLVKIKMSLAIDKRLILYLSDFESYFLKKLMFVGKFSFKQVAKK